MKRLSIIALSAVALFIGTAVAPAKTPIIAPQDGCAAGFTIENALACGGASYGWYAFESSPPGGQFVGSYMGNCHSWENGYVTYTWNWAHRYTVRCQLM